jgi:hypothetical protein
MASTLGSLNFPENNFRTVQKTHQKTVSNRNVAHFSHTALNVSSINIWLCG